MSDRVSPAWVCGRTTCANEIGSVSAAALYDTQKPLSMAKLIMSRHVSGCAVLEVCDVLTTMHRRNGGLTEWYDDHPV